MIKPKKSLGQNFLIDQNIIKKIVDSALIPKTNILEIGPGTGNLTSNILRKNPKSLILIEKDKNLYEGLKKKIKLKNLKIFNKDILDTNLEKILYKNTIVFGNLPYNISTQILVKLINLNKKSNYFQKLILMFQKEVANKIIAKYKSKDFSRLSVISNFNLKVTNRIDISKNCFWPVPKVDSTLLVFEPISQKKINIRNLKNLEHVTRIMFSNKRKMINRCFKKLFHEPDKISKEIGLDLTLRPSEINEKTYYKITELFEKYNN